MRVRVFVMIGKLRDIQAVLAKAGHTTLGEYIRLKGGN